MCRVEEEFAAGAGRNAERARNVVSCMCDTLRDGSPQTMRAAAFIAHELRADRIGSVDNAYRRSVTDGSHETFEFCYVGSGVPVSRVG